MEPARVSTAPQPSPRNARLRIVALIMVVGLVSGIGGGLLVMHFAGGGTTISRNSVSLKESSAIIDVAKNVSPSVVSITSQSTQQNIFGQTSTAQASGTGIIVSTDGLILTNKHVVPDDTSDYTVISNDGKQYKNAKVVARDPRNDIALVKISASNLKPATLGDSSAVQVGQQVVAIGNALGQYQNTVTSGIISGRGRPITAADSDGSGAEQLTNLFQTDAAINPGNSGGPLVDLSGAVIGVDTAVSNQGQNLGFALPINDAKQALDSYLQQGRIVRPYLGVRYVQVTPGVASTYGLNVTQGALIVGSDGAAAVVAGSPAANAGLQQGDVITKIAGDELNDTNTLSSLVSKHKVGDTVEVTYVRDGKTQTAKVKLLEAPSS